MNLKLLLNLFTEFGIIEIKDSKVVNCIKPLQHIHQDRFKYFIKFIEDYLSCHPNITTSFIYTLFDGIREHSEPSDNPEFLKIDFTNSQHISLLLKYRGVGSAGESGRFISKYEVKDIFPVFDYKFIGFDRHKNDKYTTLIPDPDFIKTNGYIDLKKEVDQNDIPFKDKINKIFWRSGVHGKGYHYYDSQKSDKPLRCLRKILVDYSQEEIKKGNYWIDAKPSYNTTKKEILQYKYLISVPGEVSSWSNLVWLMYSNSVVFLVENHNEQWYYKNIKAWEHYIPVKPDLSDLSERYNWALENEEKCKEIAEKGKEFTKTLTYESVVKTLEI